MLTPNQLIYKFNKGLDYRVWRCTYDPNNLFEDHIFQTIDIQSKEPEENWAEGCQFIHVLLSLKITVLNGSIVPLPSQWGVIQWRIYILCLCSLISHQHSAPIVEEGWFSKEFLSKIGTRVAHTPALAA